jgi:YYY domain-containing protein
MDVAFLASAARAVAMPPPDPWFAGEPINYYYLGFLLHGAPARLAGVPVAVGYNLALATTFSMALVAAFGVGSAAVFPWLRGRAAAAAGLLAAGLVVLAGNLVAPLALLRDPGGTLAEGWWSGVGWGASRVVRDAGLAPGSAVEVENITEFPFFSLLLGDLHPHLMALPFFLATLGLARSLLREGEREDPRRASTGSLARVAVVGAVAGALYALNSWDYPTALLVVLAALWVGLRDATTPRRAAALALLGVASLLAWAPFWLRFEPPVGQGGGESPLAGLPLLGRIGETVGLVTWERTSVGEFLTMFGIPYLVGLAFLAARLWHTGALTDLGSPSAATVVGAVSVVAVAIAIPAPLLLVCGAPLAAAVLLLRREGRPTPAAIVVGLFALGLAIVLVTEFAFLRDVFGNRMNTVFKAYYQAWMLLAVAAAVAMVLLWRAAPARGLGRALLGGACALAVAAGAVYPVLASVQWTATQGPAVAGPRAWLGLDGMAYVGRSSPDELASLRWLAANARPGDVVLEAAGCAYQPISRVPSSRVSAFTGVPTVLGWAGHERQWRNGQPGLRAEIAERERAIAGMYAEPGGPDLDAYGVTLLYVGPYEREGAGRDCPLAGPYPAVGEPGFPGDGWEEVFASGETRVFRRAA